MPEDRRYKLGVTKPIRVFNPISKTNMRVLVGHVKVAPELNDLSRKFLIWLLSRSGLLGFAVWTCIPLQHKHEGAEIYPEIKEMAAAGQINQLIRSMGNAMKISCWESLHSPTGWVFQISITADPDEKAGLVKFDLSEINEIKL